MGPRLRCRCGNYTSVLNHCGYCGVKLDELGLDVSQMLTERKKFGRQYGLWSWTMFPVWMALWFFLITHVFSVPESVTESLFSPLYLLAALYLAACQLNFFRLLKKRFPHLESIHR